MRIRAEGYRNAERKAFLKQFRRRVDLRAGFIPTPGIDLDRQPGLPDRLQGGASQGNTGTCRPIAEHLDQVEVSDDVKQAGPGKLPY